MIFPNSATEARNEKMARLFTEYKKDMLSAANYILKDINLAEDAVNDACISLTNNLHKLDENNPAAVKAYIIKSVKTSSYKIYNERKRRYERELPLDYAVNAAAADYSSDNMTSLLSIEIEKMPPIYSSVIILKYAEGLENNEIALKLHISVAAVEKRLSRAKKKLKKIIERSKRYE